MKFTDFAYHNPKLVSYCNTDRNSTTRDLSSLCLANVIEPVPVVVFAFKVHPKVAQDRFKRRFVFTTAQAIDCSYMFKGF